MIDLEICRMDLSAIQQSKIIADWFRVSYPYPRRSTHVKPKLDDLGFPWWKIQTVNLTFSESWYDSLRCQYHLNGDGHLFVGYIPKMQFIMARSSSIYPYRWSWLYRATILLPVARAAAKSECLPIRLCKEPGSTLFSLSLSHISYSPFSDCIICANSRSSLPLNIVILLLSNYSPFALASLKLYSIPTYALFFYC